MLRSLVGSEMCIRDRHKHHQAQQPQPTSSHQGSSNINLMSSRQKADYIRELLGITGRANHFVGDPGHEESDSSQQPVRASSAQHKKFGETLRPRKLGSTTRGEDNFHHPGHLVQRKLTFYFKKQPPRATPSSSPRNASSIEKTASRGTSSGLGHYQKHRLSASSMHYTI